MIGTGAVLEVSGKATFVDGLQIDNMPVFSGAAMIVFGGNVSGQCPSIIVPPEVTVSFESTRDITVGPDILSKGPLLSRGPHSVVFLGQLVSSGIAVLRAPSFFRQPVRGMD